VLSAQQDYDKLLPPRTTQLGKDGIEIRYIRKGHMRQGYLWNACLLIPLVELLNTSVVQIDT